MHLYYDFLQIYKNCIRNAWNAQNSFQWKCHGKNTDIGVSRFKCGKFSWRWWAFLSFPGQLHRKKSRESLQRHKQRLARAHFGSHWQVTSFLWNMPVKSKGGIKHRTFWILCINFYQVEAAVNLPSKNMAVLTAVVSHPPYLPDMVPCNFLPFPRTKLQLWWCNFQDVSKIWELLITQQNSKKSV